MRKILMLTNLLALATFMSTAHSKEDILLLQGSYAGTFLCDSGEMGMTLKIKMLETKNEKENENSSKHKSRIEGVLNFYPTVGNPKAAKGAYLVNGTALTYSNFSRIELNPGKWLDKPENFGASGLKGLISKSGKLSGSPTFDGCHKLSLTKLYVQ